MARPQTISDEQIHRAARDVFVEHGPGAPVALIAEKLGVSHAALFGRVGTKEQLLLDALCSGRPPAMERLAGPPPDHHAREALVEMLAGLMVFFRQVVPNLVVLRAAGRSMADLPTRDVVPPPVALRRSLARWLERASERGVLPPMHAWAIAEGLLGAMEARCFNGHLGGKPFAPGRDDTFVRDLVDGLLGKTP
jgi:AcrR family transcriptional regulator